MGFGYTYSRVNSSLWRSGSVHRNFSADTFNHTRPPQFLSNTIYLRQNANIISESKTKSTRAFSCYTWDLSAEEFKKPRSCLSIVASFSCNRLQRQTRLVPFVYRFSTTTTNVGTSSTTPEGSNINNTAKDREADTSKLQQTVTGPTFHVAKISYHDGSIEFLRNIALVMYLPLI
jgi:hypothetical protein